MVGKLELTVHNDKIVFNYPDVHSKLLAVPQLDSTTKFANTPAVLYSDIWHDRSTETPSLPTDQDVYLVTCPFAGHFGFGSVFIIRLMAIRLITIRLITILDHSLLYKRF